MKTYRALLVVGVLLVLVFVVQMAQAAPAITASPASATPKQSLTVSGTGFTTPFEAVDVYFDLTDLTLAVTSATGTFSCTLTVPAMAAPGTHWVTAIGRASGLAAQKALTITTPWAQFRKGPFHQGHNPLENVLASSTVVGLNEAWSYPTGADVYSSPTVANGVVYVGSHDKKVYALNATTGAFKWSYTTGGSVYSSPAVANGVVYVGSTDFNVYALTASTGTLLWTGTTGGQIFLSSPAVADGRLYVGSDDAALHAYALDPWLEGGAASTLAGAARALPPDPAELIPDYLLEPQFKVQQVEAQTEEGTDSVDEPDPAR
jgi:outer membrane protein assembly factor BamB